jgi:hypothetical protein
MPRSYRACVRSLTATASENSIWPSRALVVLANPELANGEGTAMSIQRNDGDSRREAERHFRFGLALVIILTAGLLAVLGMAPSRVAEEGYGVSLRVSQQR